MSVVARDTRRRWLLVSAAIAALMAAPGVTSAGLSAIDAATAAAAPSPRALVAAALRSQQVPFSGLARSRGTLGLPDLPAFGSTSALLGQSTALRAWWRSPDRWRVDVLSGTGETGGYGIGPEVVTWDYEQRDLVAAPADPAFRLPRPDDLLPPSVARRLLGGVGPQDRVSTLAGRRVAGRHGYGLRVEPGDSRSTIGRIELWVDRTGLPLEVHAIARTGGVSLQTAFTSLDLDRPDGDLLDPPSPPGTAVQQADPRSDPAVRLQRFSPWRMPATLAGLAASGTRIGGAATYGTGLVKVAALPLPPRLTDRLIDASVERGIKPLELPGIRLGVLLTSPLLNSVLLIGPDRAHAYLLTGLVTAPLLTQAATELLARPPAAEDA